MPSQPTDSFPADQDPFLVNPRETFNYKQRGFADALMGGVYAEDHKQSVHRLLDASWNFTYLTDRPNYIEDKGQQLAVIEYVADSIDEHFLGDARKGDKSADMALTLLDQAFTRYTRLACYPGHDIRGDQLARVYFPMRNFFREACRIAMEQDKPDVLSSWQEQWLNYSNGPEESMRSRDEEAAIRKELYERFLLDPNDDSIWGEITHQATHEAERGEVFRNSLKGVRLSDLVVLASDIRGLPKDEQYARMAKLTTSGDRWSELLPGFGDASLANTIKRFLSVVVDPEQVKAENKSSRRQEAVVLGAHDVKALHSMVFSGTIKRNGGYFIGDPIAEHVAIIESSDTLRDVAEIQLDGQNVEFVKAEFTNLPYKPKSVDLLVGNRATEVMDAHATADFYLELARVLKRGGMYIDGTVSQSADELIVSRWKGLLAQMVVDTVQRTAHIPDRMSPEKEESMLNGLGLHAQHFNYEGKNIRVLVKQASIKDVGYHALQGRGVEHLFAITEEQPEQ
jgi:hypothetical protein